MYKWDEIDRWLGVLPDVVIADAMGARQTTVSIRRSNLGIERNQYTRNMGRTTLWSPEIAPLIFEKYTDEEIAERFNIDLDYVRGRRWIYDMRDEGKLQEFRDSIRE